MDDMEIDSSLSRLLSAASEFASYPGQPSDASVKEFLDRFPLSDIISALSLPADDPNVESILVSCLERMFKTKYGLSLIPNYLPFIQAGLSAESQMIKSLACEAVANFLQMSGDKIDDTVVLLVREGLYPLLVDCLIYGDERVAKNSTKAIVNLSMSPTGMGVIFHTTGTDAVDLKSLLYHSFSLERVRVFALIAKLFSSSRAAAESIYDSHLLDTFVEQVYNSNDLLITLSILEILFELASSPHGPEFLLRTKVLQLLISLIRTSAESPLRLRAVSICGRLLSLGDALTETDEAVVKDALSAIGKILDSSGNEDLDECEIALDALGQIGTFYAGSELLCSSSSPLVRHVIEAAFQQHIRCKQLAALHTLANIVGEGRTTTNALLSDHAEECLRHLIYSAASRSPKLTPSGMLLSVLQQSSETRVAAYRVISGLVSRPWFLQEVCMKEDIINMIADPQAESTKSGMEARHQCCIALNDALVARGDQDGLAFSAVTAKLQEAIRRGPYVSSRRSEAQPAVVPAEGF